MRVEIQQLVSIFLQWMSGDEESQDFLFVGQTLVLVPFRHGGKALIIIVGRIFLLEDAEQAMLSHFSIALGFLGAFHGLVQHRHKLGPVAKAVHGAALD